MRDFSIGLFTAGAILMFASSSHVALAQSSASPLCRAVESAPDSNDVRPLVVACGQGGVSLGPVDAYELIRLPALRAAVVVTSFDRSRRVWLITSEGGRELGLEEITGTIARAAGRGASLRLDGLELDFGDGATGQLTAGIMSVRAEGGGASSKIDLTKLVARMRAVRAGARAKSDK